jgi:RNA polymerase sigma factor (sigma-70 family)
MKNLYEKLSGIENALEAFSLLIRSAIRKTCPSIDKSDMDDIEQEVKIAVWKEIRKSEKEIRNLGSYIWRVAYTTTSKVMKRLSAQRRALIDPQDEALDEEEKFKTSRMDLPEIQLQNKELAEIIRESVDSLIESRKQVVKLYLSGLTADEITKYFGWSDGKARNLLSRGLTDLRKGLGEKGIEIEE